MSENTKEYSFDMSHFGDGQYDAHTTSASRRVSLDEDAPWPKVMYEFCMFLSGIYGYDIADQIIVKNKVSGDESSLTTLVFENNGYSFNFDKYYEEDEDR